MRLVAALVGRLLALYVRIVAATSRVSGPVTRDQVVIAIWHEHNLVASVVAWKLRSDRHHVSFSTQTFRGEVMTSMLASLRSGSVPLPAPDQKGEGARLARELARLGREGSSLVVSPDGPTGPYREAKPGALIAARESGLPIQPWAFSARRSFRLRRRWDRQVVPLPFSRVRVEAAEPIRVARREPLRPLVARLQAALDEVAAAADGPSV
jgi:lysophospholipid acyltransferase (LPLAT)-like uncharacterized protein